MTSTQSPSANGTPEPSSRDRTTGLTGCHTGASPRASVMFS